MSEAADARRVREILMTVKSLAAEYYRLTGKPLGPSSESTKHERRFAELGALWING